MNELRITPKPWDIRDISYNLDKSRLLIIHRENGRGISVCRLYRTVDAKDENMANALVVAESPIMLEFICDLVSGCDYGTETLSQAMRERAEKIINNVYGKENSND